MKNKILSIVKIILVIILATSLYRIYSYNKADKEFKTATREVQEKFQEPLMKKSLLMTIRIRKQGKRLWHFKKTMSQ